MKKSISLLLIFALIMPFAFLFGGCEPLNVKFHINFIVDEEVYETIESSGNEYIRLPEDPTKDDYDFMGWYFDKDTWQTELIASTYENTKIISNVNIFAYFKEKEASDNEYIIRYSSTYVTVGENYNHFISAPNDYTAKKSIDSLIAKAQKYLDFYASDEYEIETLKSAWQDIKVTFSGSEDEVVPANYITAINKYKAAVAIHNEQDIQNAYDNMVTTRNLLKTKISNFAASLVASEFTDEAYKYLHELLGYFNAAEEYIDNVDEGIAIQIHNSKIIDKIAELLKFEPDKNLINDLYQYIDEADLRNSIILQQIQMYYSEFQSSTNEDDINELFKLITKYYLNANKTFNLINSSILMSGLENCDMSIMLSIRGFENLSLNDILNNYENCVNYFDETDSYYQIFRNAAMVKLQENLNGAYKAYAATELDNDKPASYELLDQNKVVMATAVITEDGVKLYMFDQEGKENKWALASKKTVGAYTLLNTEKYNGYYAYKYTPAD